MYIYNNFYIICTYNIINKYITWSQVYNMVYMYRCECGIKGTKQTIAHN